VADAGGARILVVEDDAVVRNLVERHLVAQGHSCQACSDARAGLELLGSSRFDVLLASAEMPGLDGIRLLKDVRALDPGLPVILTTGRGTFDVAVRALQLGAYDYITKPFQLDALDRAIERAQQRRRMEMETAHYRQALEERVHEKTAHLLTAQGKLERQADELRATIDRLENSFDLTVTAMVNAIEARDSETSNHCRRARAYTLLLARRLGLPAEHLRDVGWGALLHDVGKIGVPDEILLKKGPLTEEEWRLMKRHPLLGYQMVKDIDFLSGASKLVLAHHEKWDGSGYPYGLAGEEIPIGARCFAIADALEAITSRRSYKPAFSFDVADERIAESSGTHFEPELVRVFLSIPRHEIERVRAHYEDNCAEVIDTTTRARPHQYLRTDEVTPIAAASDEE